MSECLKIMILPTVGGLIVDPEQDIILARGYTDTKWHPLQHAVMKCIDEIARLQGGGAWKDPATVNRTSDNERIISVDIDGTAVEQESGGPVKKRSKVESYLCTKYDLYTTHEPCIM